MSLHMLYVCNTDKTSIRQVARESLRKMAIYRQIIKESVRVTILVRQATPRCQEQLFCCYYLLNKINNSRTWWKNKRTFNFFRLQVMVVTCLFLSYTKIPKPIYKANTDECINLITNIKRPRGNCHLDSQIS